jgi:outer membrane receptor for ferrienterochelin and colicin
MSDKTDLTNKVSIHELSYDRGILTQAVDPLAVGDLETKSEMGLNLESILKTVIADKHQIVAGVKVQSVQFGPNQREQYMVGTTSTTLNGGYPNGYKYVYVTDAGLDNTYSAYVEDSFEATNKLTLVGGVGYEYNDFVEVGGKLLPRGAIIYSFNDKWSAKYCFNTGYERPPVDKKFHKMFGHVQKSEDVQETDVQISYSGENTRFSLTGFSYMIFNYFTWSTEVNAAGALIAQGHYNAGEGKSTGGEFDIRHNLTSKLSLFGNWTVADTKINDAYSNGDPKHLYNVGFDYLFTKNLSLDMNMNGWMQMPNGYPDNNTWSGGGEQIVDMAIVADNVLGKPLTVTLFAKNLFNVSSRVGMTGWPGYTYLEGGSYGAKVGYKF